MQLLIEVQKLLMDTIRGLIRPLLTVAIVSCQLWVCLHPWLYTPEQMGMLFLPMMLVLGFWFGERACRNLGLDLGALLARKVKQ